MATDPDDPFAPRADDRTVMVPTPRRGQTKPAEPAPRPTPAPSARPAAAPIEPIPETVGANPLLTAATPILRRPPWRATASAVSASNPPVG